MAGPTDWEGLELASGRYAVTAKLGEGGMGSVFRAWDRNIESDVVIKIPRPAMMEDPEFASRFTREIRSLVRLSHPHIVKVSDVGTWEGTPFAVMQFLPGGSLDDHRPKGRAGEFLPCSPRSIPDWLESVAKALDYIHTQGYVHRDVKPGNILFDAEGHAFLSDFGVAKVLSSADNPKASQTSATGAGMVLGTPEYMAPELVMGEKFDGRVDQYALAVTAYELLCGRRPFEDDIKTKVLVLQTTKAPPSLTEWIPGLPERLCQSILKGLNKNPNERYPSCTALAVAVSAAARAAAEDERIRLKCPNCRKSGSLAAKDFARMSEAGRPPLCPECKVAMVLSEESQKARSHSGGGGSIARSPAVATTESYSLGANPGPESGGGGTTIFSAQPGANEPGSNVPQFTAGGTVAMAAQTGPRPGASAPETQRSQASRPARTVVEAAYVPPERVAQAPPLQEFASVQVGQGALAPGKPSVPPWALMAGGGGVAGAICVIGLLALNQSRAPQPDLAATRKPQTAVGSAPVKKESPPAKEREAAPKIPPPGASESVASTDRGAGGAPSSSGAADRFADRAKDTDRSGPAKHENTRPPQPKEPPAVAVVHTRKAQAKKNHAAGITVDPFDLKQKPVNVKYFLEKVIAERSNYAGKLVIPAGMYNLREPSSASAGGPRKIRVTRWQLDENAKKPLGMSVTPGIEIEVEANLATHLDRMNLANWVERVAVIGVLMTREGPLLARIELLDRFQGGRKKAAFNLEGDVDYFTTVITAEGAKAVAQADDTEWEQAGRMLHIANLYKKRVSLFVPANLNRQFEQLRTAMNTTWEKLVASASNQTGRN
jgi:serine/threonine protein kinase